MARRVRLSVMAFILLAVWNFGQNRPLAEVTPEQARFTQAASGVITDSLTGLDWYVGPNHDNNWHEAKAWIENLALDGGGWRMPTIPELKAIYQNGASPYNLDPLFKTTGVWVWSGQLHNPWSAWGYAFYNGLEGWHGIDYGYGRQVFAVRPRR